MDLGARLLSSAEEDPVECAADGMSEPTCQRHTHNSTDMHTTAQTCTHPVLFHTGMKQKRTRTQCDFTPIVHFSKTAEGVYVPAPNLFRFFGKQTQDFSTLMSKSLVAL